MSQNVDAYAATDSVHIRFGAELTKEVNGCLVEVEAHSVL